MSTTETKVTHTPGEWHVEPTGKVFMVASGDGVRIKHIAQMLTKGDANLIAAAPDMLEALEQTRTALRLSQAAPKLLAIVETAIAKARGKQ